MGNIVREIDYSDMEKSCKENAKNKFKRPAYASLELSEQARKLIRAQGKQMDDKGVSS